ncbi:MAG: NAD(P)-dependent oxidoreductase [Proteobacteria bacterium]|uniref:NAD(P)-dependent oxidoreductase n=1 Tax=Rudaea sp. TaxID=2136325 RepID=UPI001D7B83F9|nr:NAD(P)-dependent oxidoreductase [Pseudomonadota bacterium]MBS0566130.1 NAD(P)-dependent oxidoreductase [Pseudomonadota bacterium]
MNAGFVGLGTMGLPMALNLLRAGQRLTVWNRTPEKSAALIEHGAKQAVTFDELCRQSEFVLLMLLNETAIDAVLGRSTPAFRARVAGRTFVHLGTTSPEYSQELARDLRACGACYVEAPVSGSRVPAEQGRLVGMVSGAVDVVEEVLPLLEPLCTRWFRCGAVPGALRMKLAVNHYLIATVVALCETVHVARACGIDLAVLRCILDAGPMASEVSRGKLDKLVREDFSPQAAVGDVATIADLVANQAARAHKPAPLMRNCVTLFRRARDAGLGDLDMAAVVRAFGFPEPPP